MIGYFGKNVDRLMEYWYAETFMPEVSEKYGEGTQLAAMILPPVRLDLLPQFVTRDDGLRLISHPDKKVTGEDGLVDNVIHKLNFVLRTGLPSSEARLRPDLVEPGIFHGLAPRSTAVMLVASRGSTKNRTVGLSSASSIGSLTYGGAQPCRLSKPARCVCQA